ncbi:MAG: ABC-2 family transporter protein [Paenibacillaceae bacterium]
MHIFIKAIQLNLKVFLTYRKGFLISIIIHPIVLVLNIYLFTSIFEYNGTSEIKDYSLEQMVWYFAVTIFVFIFTFNFADRRMSNYIISGDLGPLLLRPISLYRYELANAIALRTAGVLFEFIPDMIIYSIIYPPVFLTLLSFSKFLIVIIPAFLLNFLIRYLIGLSAIITMNNSSMNRVTAVIISLLGGAMIPLDFFPLWLQKVCDYLPFKYIFYEPVQFFLNRGHATSTEALLYVLMMQFLWIAGLYLLTRIVWSILMKKIVLVGG